MVGSMKSLLTDLAAELDEEANQKRSPEEKKLHAVAQKLLILERDLKAPGATRTSEDRADRILEAISKEKF